jgi:hypothetical protein
MVRLVHFGDYDHDGAATEFYLQTEALPCGKSSGVVVGISTSDPHLHVFGTATTPKKALYMQKREWDAVREAKAEPVQVIDWQCYDHAAETQTELKLNWMAKGIDGVQLEYTCPEKGQARGLVRQVPLSRIREISWRDICSRQ